MHCSFHNPAATAPMEFASPEWLDFFFKLLFAKAVLDPVNTVSVACEVYLNVPAHIPSCNGQIAWTRRVVGDHISVALEECSDEEADVKTVGDYEAFRALVRLRWSDNSLEDFRKMVEELVASGRIRPVCDKRAAHPPPDFAFHNFVAALTA